MSEHSSNNDYCIEKGYSTLDLIAELEKELQKFPEVLALLFPGRIKKFKHQYLSFFWQKAPNYISKVIYKVRCINNDFRFPNTEDGLIKLEENIKVKLGFKGKKCISLIKKYRNEQLTTLEFINLIKNELGKVSGYVKVNDYELGLILKGNKKYFERLKARINNPNDKDYNPNFKLSRERLTEFKKAVQLLFDKQSKKCLDYINKYEKLNPNLKDYSGQQYTLKNPHIFANLDILDKFYWLGFLYADAYINKKHYRITFELSSKDRKRVIAFAKFLGLDLKYIKNRIRILIHRGVPKLFRMTYIQPICKSMTKDLCKLGYCEVKADRKELPYFIQDLIKNAKIQDWKNWHYTLPGKKALAWLLGFYDGDGSYLGWHTARILSASKELLDQIKIVFNIPNEVVVPTEPDVEIFIFDHKILSKGFYHLNLGGMLFKPCCEFINRV